MSNPVYERYPEFENPQNRPRYTGLPTFMRCPYQEDLDAVDIALIGVPYDGGVTNRTGARHGPREIRNQSSLMRRINQATGISPHELARVADVGDAWVQSPFTLEASLDSGTIGSGLFEPGGTELRPHHPADADEDR